MRSSLSQLPWRLLVPTALGLIGGGVIGWRVGRQALRGVHAPETAPVLASQAGGQTAEFRSEAEVLKRIQTRMSRLSPLNAQPNAQPDTLAAPAKAKPQPPASNVLGPLSIQIRDTRLTTDQLVWAVVLNNQGDRPYALLGSNLEVRDDQGRTSVIEPLDLPSEIVAGETVAGQFRVPLLLLEGARQLRLYGTGLPSKGIELPLPSRPLTVPLPSPNPPSNPVSP